MPYYSVPRCIVWSIQLWKFNKIVELYGKLYEREPTISLLFIFCQNDFTLQVTNCETLYACNHDHDSSKLHGMYHVILEWKGAKNSCLDLIFSWGSNYDVQVQSPAPIMIAPINVPPGPWSPCYAHVPALLHHQGLPTPAKIKK